MMKAVFIATLAVIAFSSIKCKIAKAKQITTTAAVPTSKEYQEDRNDIDVMGIMKDCNETFRIEMSYLEQLNDSGSFPDETDRTPKCYIRCVLETSGAASEDGQFDPRQAALVLEQVRGGFDTNMVEEIASTCVERKETCKCERSYQFIKCIMEKEIEKFETNE